MGGVRIKSRDLAQWIAGHRPAALSGWQARLPALAAYVLVILLAYLLAGLGWEVVRMFAGDGVPVAGPAAPVPAAANGELRAESTVPWKQFALFGREADDGGAVRPVRAVPRPARPTEPVRVTLYGTIASDDPENSLAVVAVKGGKAEIYRAGDELQTGVTLKSVSAWSIVISVGDDDQVVGLIDASLLPQTPAPPLPVPLPATGSSPGTAEERRINDPEVVAKLQEYRAALGANPLSLMDKVRAYPVERNGEPYGVRIRPGTDRQLLGQVGLRSGDILISLNGLPVNDVKNLPGVIGQLKDQSELVVELERAGKRQNLRMVVENLGDR